MAQEPTEPPLAKTPLAQWRTRRGMTQLAVAESIGVSLSTYCRLERGRTLKPAVGYLVDCARVLGCSLSELLTDAQREWIVLDESFPLPVPTSAPTAAANEEPSGATNGVHSRHMGRAQGIANAAGRYPRRQRTVGRYLSVNEMQMVRAAIRGDFEPFLRAAQTPTPASDAMLDSEVVVTICRLAMDNARADHARTLDRRLVAGGVGTQTLRAGIVQAVSHQAEHDLRSSLYRLVEEQAAGKARVATPDDLAKQARALLDNRISEALGEPVDRELAAGVWQALRGAN